MAKPTPPGAADGGQEDDHQHTLVTTGSDHHVASHSSGPEMGSAGTVQAGSHQSAPAMKPVPKVKYDHCL